MRLSIALEEKKYDLRLRDKLMHEGKLSAKNVDEYLSSLPDDQKNSIPLDKDKGIQNKAGAENPASPH